ncbi:hypothetical protein [Terrisporobacter sp.]
MEIKVINGKEYTKVGIKQLSINGENRENSFSLNDVDNQDQISFDIKIDYDLNNNDTSTFPTNPLNTKNLKPNNKIEITSKPANTISSTTDNLVDTNSDTPTSKHKTSYLYYVICAVVLQEYNS